MTIRKKNEYARENFKIASEHREATNTLNEYRNYEKLKKMSHLVQNQGGKSEFKIPSTF